MPHLRYEPTFSDSRLLHETLKESNDLRNMYHYFIRELYGLLPQLHATISFDRASYNFNRRRLLVFNRGMEDLSFYLIISSFQDVLCNAYPLETYIKHKHMCIKH